MQWNRTEGKPIWTYEWRPEASGTYTYEVAATDHDGKTTTFRGSVNVTNPFPVIDPPSSSTFSSLSQSLVVRPDGALTDVRAIQYVINGTAYNMVAPTKERPTYWTTNPTYPGWHAGANNLTIQALEQPTYLHGFKLEGGVARFATAQRTYTVPNNFPDLGTQAAPDLPEKAAPGAVAKRTPGLEAPLLVALVGLVALALRARHDRP
jgi:hypothetical protein